MLINVETYVYHLRPAQACSALIDDHLSISQPKTHIEMPVEEPIYINDRSNFNGHLVQ